MSLIGKKGVDISSNNGSIDIAKIKSAGYDFVMIRCGFGENITSQDDNRWEENVRKCAAAGMPWGAYFYSYACSEASAKSELEHALRLLKGKKPTLPVAFDMEDTDGYKAKHGGWNKTNVDRACRIFLEGIAKDGYYPMLYAGFEEMNNYISAEVWNKYDIWFPHWASACGYKGKNLCMWQYGGETNKLESNSIPGVGVIDKNICYKDYPAIIKQGGYNGWTKTGSTATTTAKATVTEAQLRQNVADIINSWLGAKEGDSVHAEILRIYNAQNRVPVDYKMQVHDAWCAATVSAAWLKAGIAQYTGTECGCGRFRDDAIKRGIWVEDDAYKPKIGDAVIYYWSDNGVGDCKTGADHIGLVTAVNGNSFTVTEGNTGNGVVGKRTMQVNGRYIRGFIAPNYAEIAKKVSGVVTVTKPSTTTTTVAATIPDIFYRVRVAGHWQSQVKNGATAGIRGKAITDIAIKAAKGSVKYRVHIKGGSWLPWVTGYNTSEHSNGYAGNGKAIDAVQVYYSTPADVVNAHGYYKAKYLVSPLKKGFYSYQYDTENTNGQDGYAGSYGKTIDRFQILLSK